VKPGSSNESFTKNRVNNEVGVSQGVINIQFKIHSFLYSEFFAFGSVASRHYKIVIVY